MEYRLTYASFKENLQNGRLLGLRCRDCQAVVVPPKMLCPHCQSADMEIEQISGEGEIQTYTVLRVVPEGFTAPIVVGLVQLKEGPLVMGNVDGVDPDKVTMDTLMGRKVRIGCRLLEADKYSAGERVVLTFQVQGQ